ncbi:MAG: hypothetical protein A2600_13620 [Candidatus Lambdaproteobacteria bacterium RIFOXYD1_FULL_56_27]|uniref:Uncharacterized protein n=1 Tax=Candidatus Lambdaproteobacteria bacterium RIFOXYD2_FULL_56_26 TaxID=1817773 RepID=A0A1F6GU28_9PROT|nr:MAG: hypothetical protein A2426_02215 [Candidatus Lambdaproteobacteria bacterium RIFOXYC1_FULL_56_13]OGH01539.1 MAG: hypothetical protein A2557_13995 [Candidatus Lambdaproteobacteria bacterium RIFOXYD2_FULL_56_26]OGH06760.1 MAG: hypothetical protein A2600_13620 [Candidatus Lambdaproteobacteria bacterium RIFOXYD1_FULL_56_27]
MDFKARVLAWLAEDEDRIVEESELLEAFQEADPALLKEIRRERVVEMVAQNIKEMPHLKFHDLKNYYPFPTSAEVKAAQAKLDPSLTPEPAKRH